MNIRLTVRSIRCKGFLNNVRNFSYYHRTDSEPLSAMTMGQLFDTCVNKHYDKEAIVSLHENKRYTYEEIKLKIDKVCGGLLSLDLNIGDRIGLWTTNRTEMYMTFIAAAKLGLILVNLNPAYQASEIEYCVKKVGIKTLVIDNISRAKDHYNILCEILPELKSTDKKDIDNSKFPSLKNIVSMSKETQSGTINFEDLLNSTQDLRILNEREKVIDVDAPFNIQFTSGTTGNPKAATTSQHNVVNNSYRITKRLELHRKHCRICVQVPLFHAFGITPTMSGSLHWGSTLVLPSPVFSPTRVLQAIHQEKCNVLYGTPTMYSDIINKQKELNLDINVDLAFSGGAPQSIYLMQQMKDVLKLQRILSLYGLSETTAGVCVSNYNDSIEKIHNTVGQILDHTEVKVIDSNGKIVPFGVAGELCVRGYCNMLEYWEDPEKTNETMTKDRWLKTGDKCILHEDGYASIVGRIKDMIIRGGENIYPKEIEDFLIHHPCIKEIQIVGVPDKRLGEEICAFVICEDGKHIIQKDIESYCHEKIAYFKIPKYLRIIKAYPRTTSGKIKKFELRNMFIAE